MTYCAGMSEGAAFPRGDTEDTEVYRKHGDNTDTGDMLPPEPDKETISCYTGASCDNTSDIVTVQPTPMLVSIGWVNKIF